MSAHRFKPNKPRVKMPCNPLPKRNKREATVRRIAAAIKTPAQFEAVLSLYPPYMREAWIRELEPHLKFKPGELEKV